MYRVLCVHVRGESLGGTQGQMSEWEPGFVTHRCVERERHIILCLICSPSFLLVFVKSTLPHLPAQVKDLEEGVQTEGGGWEPGVGVTGALGQGWGLSPPHKCQSEQS